VALDHRLQALATWPALLDIYRFRMSAPLCFLINSTTSSNDARGASSTTVRCTSCECFSSRNSSLYPGRQTDGAGRLVQHALELDLSMRKLEDA
jgi:hypothetical protein